MGNRLERQLTKPCELIYATLGTKDGHGKAAVTETPEDGLCYWRQLKADEVPVGIGLVGQVTIEVFLDPDTVTDGLVAVSVDGDRYKVEATFRQWNPRRRRNEYLSILACRGDV